MNDRDDLALAETLKNAATPLHGRPEDYDSLLDLSVTRLVVMIGEAGV